MEYDIVELPELQIQDVEVGSLRDGYREDRLLTNRGVVTCRYYESPAARKAMICVGGIGGDWDTPAKGLYPRLCKELIAESISSLRVRFRHPTDLEESLFDVLAGIGYLERENVDSVALIGHSFGGAVVIQAAVASPLVVAVVTLATQGYGTRAVPRLASRCSILLIHGTRDRVLSRSNSEYVYSMAREPKRIVLLDGAGHNLDEAADEVHQLVYNWILAGPNDLAK